MIQTRQISWFRRQRSVERWEAGPRMKHGWFPDRLCRSIVGGVFIKWIIHMYNIVYVYVFISLAIYSFSKELVLINQKASKYTYICTRSRDQDETSMFFLRKDVKPWNFRIQKISQTLAFIGVWSIWKPVCTGTRSEGYLPKECPALPKMT